MSQLYAQTPGFLIEHALEREGCRLHYWTGGVVERPMLAFLHGATMDHRMFNAQLMTFAENYRVLVWDARGHGKSRPVRDDFSVADCADDLVALLDQLSIQQVVLCGQSMGGYIAQSVYLRHPTRVQAMVMIGAIPITLPYSWLTVTALRATLPMFRLWPYGNLVRLTARGITIVQEVQAYAQQVVSDLSKRDFLHIWKAVSETITTKGIPEHRIEVPLLLTHGDQDKSGSISRDMPRWAAHEPKARYIVIPDAGHNANQDNPQFFNHVLGEFLETSILAHADTGN